HTDIPHPASGIGIIPQINIGVGGVKPSMIVQHATAFPFALTSLAVNFAFRDENNISVTMSMHGTGIGTRQKWANPWPRSWPSRANHTWLWYTVVVSLLSPSMNPSGWAMMAGMSADMPIGTLPMPAGGGG